jgi:hypothetical protein
MATFPLKPAYSFLKEKGFEKEVNIIIDSKDKFGSYNTSLRRGKIIKLLKSKKLLEEFIENCWLDGNTDEGKKEIKFRENIATRFFESKGSENDEDFEDIQNYKDKNNNFDFSKVFTYEQDLQKSLVSQAEKLFPGYVIFGNNYEGMEYVIEGKRIDLLLENKSENKLLVIELKANNADYKVYGQISMYLSLLEKKFPNKIIEGVIIAGEIDDTLKIASQRDKSLKLKSYKMLLELIDE